MLKGLEHHHGLAKNIYARMQCMPLEQNQFIDIMNVPSAGARKSKNDGSYTDTTLQRRDAS